MEKISQYPEVLSNIFGFISARVLVRVALTCRAWSEPAFRRIWRDLDSVTPLLEILSPLQRMKKRAVLWIYPEDNFSFERWDRLRFYGGFVRTIVHDDSVQFQGLDGLLDPTVYLRVALTSVGRQPFLPNLQSVVYIIRHTSTADGIGVFTSASVLKLDLNIGCQISGLRALENLRTRLPNVQSISIKVSSGVSFGPLEDSLVSLLASSTHLSEVTLPRFFLSKKIWITLAALEGLVFISQTNERPFFSTLPTRRSLKAPAEDSDTSSNSDDSEAEEKEEGDDDDGGDGVDNRSEGIQGGFLKLAKLQLNTSLEGATALFLSANVPNTLTSLTMTICKITKQERLCEFLRALVSSNPKLGHVELILDYKGNSVTFEALRPLLQLDLVVFKISHRKNSLGYNRADITDMVKAWPNIISLYLNHKVYSDAYCSPPAGLNFQELILFTSFPRLERLGVYLQVDRDFQVTTLSLTSRFPRLKELAVGTSGLSDGSEAREVAIYISVLISEPDFKISADENRWGSPSRSGWRKSSDMLASLYNFRELLSLELKREEKSKNNLALWDERDNLRKENQVLRAQHERCHRVETKLKKKAALVESLKERELELQTEIERLRLMIQDKQVTISAQEVKQEANVA